MLQHSRSHVGLADLLLHRGKHLLDRIKRGGILGQGERHELPVFEELADRVLQVQLCVVKNEHKSSSNSIPVFSVVLFKGLL